MRLSLDLASDDLSCCYQSIVSNAKEGCLSKAKKAKMKIDGVGKMPKFLSDLIEQCFDLLSFEKKDSSQNSSQTLPNKKWIRLGIQTIGILFSLFGVWSFVSAVLMKWASLSTLPVVLVNLVFGLIGILFIIAGYYLFRIQAIGRKLAYLLTWLNFISITTTSTGGYTNADSVYSFRILAFQYKSLATNPVALDSMFTSLVIGLIGLQIVFLLIFLSRPVKELFDAPVNI